MSELINEVSLETILEYVVLTLSDISKAFDCVSHTFILLAKLARYADWEVKLSGGSQVSWLRMERCAKPDALRPGVCQDFVLDSYLFLSL